MSYEAQSWAAKQKTGSSGAKLVLLMLANCANVDSGQCNPRIKRIAEECEMSESAVKTHIKKLAEIGLIDIENRFVDGVQVSNQYWLKINRVGQNLTHGGSEYGPGVGQNLATEPVIINQEIETEEKEKKINTKKENVASAPVSVDAIPVKDIIARYHKILPELPKVRDAFIYTVEPSINRIWRQDKQHRELEFWDWLFHLVRKNPFWMQQLKPNLAWLLKKSNFPKIIDILDRQRG